MRGLARALFGGPRLPDGSRGPRFRLRRGERRTGEGESPGRPRRRAHGVRFFVGVLIASLLLVFALGYFGSSAKTIAYVLAPAGVLLAFVIAINGRSSR